MMNMCCCLKKIYDYEKFIECYKIAKFILKNVEIKNNFYNLIKNWLKAIKKEIQQYVINLNIILRDLIYF